MKIITFRFYLFVHEKVNLVPEISSNLTYLLLDDLLCQSFPKISIYQLQPNEKLKQNLNTHTLFSVLKSCLIRTNEHKADYDKKESVSSL